MHSQLPQLGPTYNIATITATAVMKTDATASEASDELCPRNPNEMREIDGSGGTENGEKDGRDGMLEIEMRGIEGIGDREFLRNGAGDGGGGNEGVGGGVGGGGTGEPEGMVGAGEPEKMMGYALNAMLSG